MRTSGVSSGALLVHARAITSSEPMRAGASNRQRIIARMTGDLVEAAHHRALRVSGRRRCGEKDESGEQRADHGVVTLRIRLQTSNSIAPKPANNVSRSTEPCVFGIRRLPPAHHARRFDRDISAAEHAVARECARRNRRALARRCSMVSVTLREIGRRIERDRRAQRQLSRPKRAHPSQRAMPSTR